MSNSHLSGLLATNPHFEPRDLDVLRRALVGGDCVAFVGAGFSAGVTPLWVPLLRELARRHAHLPEAADLDALLNQPSSLRLEAAAQLLEDALGEEAFRTAVKEIVVEGDGSALRRRLILLNEIPFRAILTTNFDGYPDGDDPSPALYRRILRPKEFRWWDRWVPGSTPVTMAVHGSFRRDASPVTLTRLDYRHLLHEDPQYLPFLFALFSTTTVLFLGKSFEDAYLNSLRSRIITVLKAGADRPIAYATAPAWEISATEARFLREHEAIAVLRYGDTDTADHSGFESLLGWLAEETGFAGRFSRLLDGKRIVWSIPERPESEEIGNLLRSLEMIEERARVTDRAVSIEVVEPGDLLEAMDPVPDLVVVNWGHAGADRPSTAETVLAEVRSRGWEVPVIAYGALSPHTPDNRRRVLELGGQDLAVNYERLFELVYRALAPGTAAMSD